MMSLRLPYFWLAEPRKVNITALFISGELMRNSLI